jgi:RNA polymerase sigma-70 factor (ECF subfamily)
MPPTEATLTRLHADYAVSAYRFAWSVTKDESLAQEVVQELFLKLARDAGVIATAQSERAVIFTLTRNLALDALRRRSTRQAALQRFEQELPGWFLPAADAEAEETRAQVTAALAALPEEQRSVIHLHVWEELSFREIGELLGLPTQTVASRYRYGLEKLRAQKHTLV